MSTNEVKTDRQRDSYLGSSIRKSSAGEEWKKARLKRYCNEGSLQYYIVSTAPDISFLFKGISAIAGSSTAEGDGVRTFSGCYGDQVVSFPAPRC